LAQIEKTEETLVGTDCIIRDEHETSPTLIMLDNVTQIKNFGDFIGIYTPDFFFRFKSESAKNINYRFIKKD